MQTERQTPANSRAQNTDVWVRFGYRWLHINWKSKTIFQFAAFSPHTHTHGTGKSGGQRTRMIKLIRLP